VPKSCVKDGARISRSRASTVPTPGCISSDLDGEEGYGGLSATFQMEDEKDHFQLGPSFCPDSPHTNPARFCRECV
jgi:hypothetical protein